MSSEIELICPCCSAELTIDEAGDLELIELPELEEGQFRGLGGLRVEHTDFNIQEQYKWNQQAQGRTTGQGLSSLTPIAGTRYVVVPEDIAPVLKEEPTDAEKVSTTKVMEANKKDLNKRNLK